MTNTGVSGVQPMVNEAERNKQVINDLFVGLFNDILLLEERHLKKNGAS